MIEIVLKKELGSNHIYRTTQAREVLRLPASEKIVMGREDLEVTDLKGSPAIQQKMLDGTMTKPKGVALVQATAGETIDAYARGQLGEALRRADPDRNQFLDIDVASGVGIVVLKRIDALNALNIAWVEKLRN